MLRSVVFGFFLLFCAEMVVAQQNDWGVWTTADIEKKLNKRWNAAAGLEYRTKDGLAKTDQIRSSLGAEYQPWKFIKFGAAYTLIADKKQKRDILVYRHRFTFNTTASYKFDRFTASWRPRLQATFYDKTEKDADELDNYRWVVRNRFGLKYNIRKLPLKPYVQFEIFNRIFSDIAPSYYKNRLSAGIEIGIGKRHTLDFGYKRDSELDNGKKYLFNAVTVGYTFAF
jgi:hypothetical protein